ncbi:hypothetical protein [Rhodospirillaceae bacterium SYSU D60014]|uniref:hypothetical protein n=1 Tax=Virgifigura deserti TaxID=2268457 RepID=UPI000E669B65
MRWFERLFTRRRDLPCFNSVPQHVFPRLMPVLRHLSDDEKAIQVRMDLVVPPRLPIVDEELAVIVGPGRRNAIQRDTNAPDQIPGSLSN